MSSRNGRYRLSCDLERADRLVARNRRKRLEKVLQRVSGFEVIEQTLSRHTCANKYGRSSHDFGVGMNDVARISHGPILLPYAFAAGLWVSGAR